MAIVRGKFLSRKDIWFDEEPEKIPDVDVLYYYYQQKPPPIQGIEFDEEHTLLLDLTKDQDELWKTIRKETRYKIKRAAEKDHVVYEFWDHIDSDLLNSFFSFHDQFALSHGLRKLPRSRLRSYASAGVLCLSRVSSKDYLPLSWYAHYYDKDRVFSLHSALVRHDTDTSYNQMLGRVNRYHQWQDILRFKNLETLLYDFGGWYAGTTDQKLLNINKFKEEFGGEIVKNFNYRRGITLKGKLFLRLRKLLISLLY